jgi:hypothetical protein
MSKRPLTAKQRQAIRQAEDTLFGDVKIGAADGRSVRGLKARGLCEEAEPGHVYLTRQGMAERG